MSNRILIVFLSSICLSGCCEDKPSHIDPDPKVTEFGNGIYYIEKEQNKQDFGNVLAKFAAAHPNLEITSITVDYAEDAGNTIKGRYIVCKVKQDDTQIQGSQNASPIEKEE